MATRATSCHPLDFFLISQKTTRTLSSSDESGSLGLEDSLVRHVGCALTLVANGELSVVVCHFNVSRASEVLAFDNASFDNLDGFGTSAVATAHLRVHLGHGTAERGIAVLLVHVNGEGTGEITENDAVVLDSASVLLVDLAGGNDLTLHFADLVLSLHVVPELGTGEDSVTGKNADSVKLGLGFLFAGKSATNNVELFNLNGFCVLGPASPSHVNTTYFLLTRCNTNSFDHFG